MSNKATKPAYTSLTIIGSFLVLVVTGGKLAGYDLSGLLQVQNEIVVVAGALMAIVGRVRASTDLTIV